MEKINCPRCRDQLDEEDNYCRRCGMQLKPLAGGEFAQVQVVSEPKPGRPAISDNPWVVLLMLFFVLGPFALPMLWQGRAFTPRWKWIWTLVSIGYTFVLFWLFWFITVKMIIEPLRQLQNF